MSDPAVPSRTRPDDRLESWKEIANYIGKGVRTVVRWEKAEGLPVHRHLHERRSSVFAFKSEIDAWWHSRGSTLDVEPSADRSIATSKYRSLGRWGALLALLLATVLVAWRLWPSRVTTRDTPLQFQPLTSYTGNQYSPSFSPDGSHFAFAWDEDARGNMDIFIQAIGSSKPKRLTSHPWPEFSPAWSPEGTRIAFLRRSPGFDVELLSIPSLGGPERKLADLREAHFMDAAQLSWSPDGKWLAFADRSDEGDGIYLLGPKAGKDAE
jgi:dipeptidyl aminopeptidase/acylaminoacyl peptidase/predicted DNA-binding transcriptional regulator AlpA